MNGFQTQIFEKNPTSGGLCASWKRGNYTFDGCIQWIMGSSNHNPFYKIWNELIDMENVDFVNHDIRYDIELTHNVNKYGENVFHLYTDVRILEEYLIDLAPEDSKIIKEFTNLIREIQKYELPPLIDKIPGYRTIKDYAIYLKYIPFVFLYLKWRKITNFSFSKKMKNAFLKEAFQKFFDGSDLNLLILSFPLSFYDQKCAGYPVGGSYQFAKKIEDKYISLGGKINLNSPVKRIITENGHAKALELFNGEKDFSDITISAADWQYTVFEALEGKYLNKKILELRNQKKLRVFYSVVLISLGVSRSFKDYPHLIRFHMEDGIVSPDGTKYKRIEVHIYNYDPTLTSEGKTVVSLSFYTDKGDYWIDLRKNDFDLYNKRKKEFSDIVIDLLEEKITNIKKNIEVVDVATPATYQRYTNNWKGSIQGWLPGKEILASSPVKYQLPGLKQFYYASHWSIPGGGLPIAVKTGRDIAQIICKKNKKPFKSK